MFSHGSYPSVNAECGSSGMFCDGSTALGKAASSIALAIKLKPSSLMRLGTAELHPSSLWPGTFKNDASSKPSLRTGAAELHVAAWKPALEAHCKPEASPSQLLACDPDELHAFA